MSETDLVGEGRFVGFLVRVGVWMGSAWLGFWLCVDGEVADFASFMGRRR